MIFVIMGHAGEYSDRNEWLVRAFRERQRAEDFALQLIQEGKAFEALLNERMEADSNYYYDAYDDARETPPNDPQYQRSYTGTEYVVIAVPFEDEPR